jgi:protein SCO1/2
MFLLLMSCSPSAPAIGGTDGEATEPNHGTVVDPPLRLTDWTLPSSTGRSLSLHDLRGRPALLFFGYTHCPDVCPTTLGEFKQVKQQLGAVAQQVAFVFVSVDGPRDTPAVLQRYLGAFDPAFIGVSGDDATLAKVGKEYGLYYKRRTEGSSKAGYAVDHSASTYLIDRSGQLRMLYSYGVDPKGISMDMRKLLAER